MIYFPKMNMLYLRIPKTGSTAFAAFLIEKYYDHKTYSFMRSVHEKDFELFKLAEKNSKKT